jgi:hypothetical protein
LVVRIVLWNLADSRTTAEELRARLPALPEGDVWIFNEAAERFGLISFSEPVPDFAEIRDLIGKDPEIGEEFDVEERW